MIKILHQIRQNLIKESQKGKTIICNVRPACRQAGTKQIEAND